MPYGTYKTQSTYEYSSYCIYIAASPCHSVIDGGRSALRMIPSCVESNENISNILKRLTAVMNLLQIVEFPGITGITGVSGFSGFRKINLGFYTDLVQDCRERYGEKI